MERVCVFFWTMIQVAGEGVNFLLDYDPGGWRGCVFSFCTMIQVDGEGVNFLLDYDPGGWRGCVFSFGL
jgi:hypothetical protein